MRGESLGGPAPRRVGIRDVAQRAGVAISTVSKVFSGRGDVMPSMRDRVVSAAQELGYQPNYVAQSLRRGATKLIGFVASDLADPFSAQLIAGAESVLRSAGYALVVTGSNGDPAADADNVRSLANRRVDALLMLPSNEEDGALLAALSEFDGLVVAVNSELRTQLLVDAVQVDERGGMRSVIGHLGSLGHERIAVLTANTNMSSTRRQLAGLVPRVERKNATALPIEHLADADDEDIDRLLGRPAPPTAVVACTLPMLISTLRAASAHGLSIGQDLALVGWDDTPLAEFHLPPITVVDRNPHALGVAAAELAVRRLDRSTDDDTPRTEVLAPRLVLRASCMPVQPRRNKKVKASA